MLINALTVLDWPGRVKLKLCKASSADNQIKKFFFSFLFMTITSRILKMIKDPLVWIDCEVLAIDKTSAYIIILNPKHTCIQMTGLDIKKDHLIEIAVLITDGDLNVVAKVCWIREKSN